MPVSSPKHENILPELDTSKAKAGSSAALLQRQKSSSKKLPKAGTGKMRAALAFAVPTPEGAPAMEAPTAEVSNASANKFASPRPASPKKSKTVASSTFSAAVLAAQAQAGQAPSAQAQAGQAPTPQLSPGWTAAGPSGTMFTLVPVEAIATGPAPTLARQTSSARQPPDALRADVQALQETTKGQDERMVYLQAEVRSEMASSEAVVADDIEALSVTQSAQLNDLRALHAIVAAQGEQLRLLKAALAAVAMVLLIVVVTVSAALTTVGKVLITLSALVLGGALLALACLAWFRACLPLVDEVRDWQLWNTLGRMWQQCNRLCATECCADPDEGYYGSKRAMPRYYEEHVGGRWYRVM